MKTLDIARMLCGPTTRLKSIIRYSNSCRMHDESVAEHSYYTTLFVMAIATDLLESGCKINREKAMMRAMVHDMEESFSGDFIREFKHSSPALREAVEQASNSFAHRLFKDFAPAHATKFMAWWSQAKTSDKEGRLVRFADFLSVVAYMHTEAMLGNRKLLEGGGVQGIKDYFRMFSTKEYAFLDYYTSQTAVLIREICDAQERR